MADVRIYELGATLLLLNTSPESLYVNRKICNYCQERFRQMKISNTAVIPNMNLTFDMMMTINCELWICEIYVKTN
jgi:hypothetical protein